MDEYIPNIESSDYKNYPHLLLRYIEYITDIEKIKRIIDKQSNIINPRYCGYAYESILVKERPMREEIINYCIERDRVINFKPIYKYLKYDDITSCNYDFINLLDSVDRIDFYLEYIEKYDSMKNMGLLLYYYINNKTLEETLKLIDYYINKNIINVKKINTEKNNQIRLFELVSEMLSAQKVIYNYKSYENIFSFLKNDIFNKVSKSHVINLFKKMNDYSHTSKFNEILNSLNSYITPTQFLDIKKTIYMEDIQGYINILKSRKDNARFVFNGLKNLYGNSILKDYFQMMFDNDIITHKNSTDIFKLIINKVEFIPYGNTRTNEIFHIYELFIRCGLDVNEISNYFKSSRIYFSNFKNSQSLYIYKLNINKEKILEDTLNNLRFIKRNELLKKLKVNLKKE